MRKYLLLLAAAALIAAPKPASAFWLLTGEREGNVGAPTGLGDIIATPDTNGNLIADVGEKFFIPNQGNPGDFVTYRTDQFCDPPLNNADLQKYHYLLDGEAKSVTGNVVDYEGLYQIFYDENDPKGVYNPGPLPKGDFLVSEGIFKIKATFDATGTAALQGGMWQTTGPSVPAFADFGALYVQPVEVTGEYKIDVPGQQGRIKLALHGTCIPEPGTFALLGSGLLPLLALRRRK